MTLVELLKDVKSKGITLYLKEGKLAFKAPPGAMDASLKSEIVALKPQIVDLLEKSSESRASRKKLIRPRTSSSFIPLSFAQQRIWFIDKFNEGSAQYNMPVVFKMRGHFDIELIKKALAEVVLKHEILRTNYLDTPQGPIQVVNEIRDISVNYLQFKEVESEDRSSVIWQHITRESEALFNLQQDLMARLTCIKLLSQEHVVIFNVHHIASDGWSMGILTKEFAAAYIGYLQGKTNVLTPLDIQYADFALWQQDALNEDSNNKQLEFWEKKLEGIPETHSLPLDYSRPPIQTYDGHSIMYKIDASVLKDLYQLASENDTTLFSVLQCAFSLLLSKWSNDDDIVIGSPVSGRHHHQLEPLIGLFVNTLVFRNKFDRKQSFRSLLSSAREYFFEAYANQDVPFERIVERLQPERSLSHSPLFQILFTLQNNEQVELELPEIALEWMQTQEKPTKFDLELSVTETDDALVLEWKFATQLFKVSTIERIAAGFETLLREIVKEPECDVDKLNIVSGIEISLLNRWNATETSYPSDKCIHELFEQQAEKSPDAIAAVCDEQHISYQSLNERANQLAHRLIADGVKPGQFVGLFIDRSIQMLVSTLAILKSGAAFVPLSENYPSERIDYIIRDSDIQLVISESQYEERLSHFSADKLFIDQDCDSKYLKRSNLNKNEVDVGPSSKAYLIYTSGSTGQPKGVEILHQNTVAMLSWAERTYAKEEVERVLFSTSLNFDLSIFEIFVPLCFGTQCVIVQDALTLIEKQPDVTLINTVPSAIKLLIENDAIPTTTKIINLAGEPLQKEVVNQLLEGGYCRKVFNLYGPSEDTTYSTYCQFDKPIERPPEIGIPIDNTKAFVLSKKENILPIGVVGELYLAGDGVARGYFNKPELTAERFTNKNLLGKSYRLYRTGDLVRYLPNGNLQFIGRADNQIKLRGYRIELGEIEYHIRELDVVKDVAVAVNGEGSERTLIAYVVPQDNLLTDVMDQGALINEIRQKLSQFLLDYMIPELVVFMDALPLTLNGKLDRNALPKVTQNERVVKEFQEADTPTEQLLAELWRVVLRIDTMSTNENFFEAGGNSLLLTRLFSEIKDAFNIEISMRVLFTENTIERQARLIDSYQLLNVENKNKNVEIVEEEF